MIELLQIYPGDKELRGGFFFTSSSHSSLWNLRGSVGRQQGFNLGVRILPQTDGLQIWTGLFKY